VVWPVFLTQLDDLRLGQEATLYGDKASWKDGVRQQWEAVGGVSHPSSRRPAHTAPKSDQSRAGAERVDY
jgi:hypothetical protein